MSSPEQVNHELEHLFRRQAGRIVASLTKAFGAHQLDLAETAVQEALLKAAQTWPFQGIPANPGGWIRRVAQNKAIDMLRASREFSADPESLTRFIDEQDHDTGDSMANALDLAITDDQLRLMFMCCHPSISYEARVALTLKTVCGFGVGEIARAFLAKEETIAQRLVRAKQKIREERLSLELPDRDELVPRRNTVLDTIYLLFNEGYGASAGNELIKHDICYEALRLGGALVGSRVGQDPKVYALLALLFLQASRLEARLDDAGEILLLEEQDRSRWQQDFIAAGLHYLAMAASGEELSHFHLLAGIAATHATAASFASTDWGRILAYYDELRRRDASPIIMLNRAVAIFFTKGVEAAIKELEQLRKQAVLNHYYLFAATMADFHRRDGKLDKAAAYYREALGLVGTAPERNFLQRRLKECQQPQ